MQSSCEQQQHERPTTAKSANEELFLSLVETHQRMLMNVCWAYTRTPDDRDDLFQEIVARLWSAFAGYDRERTFSTWMYRVALNVAIDCRRRGQRREMTVLSLDEAMHRRSTTNSS